MSSESLMNALGFAQAMVTQLRSENAHLRERLDRYDAQVQEMRNAEKAGRRAASQLREQLTKALKLSPEDLVRVSGDAHMQELRSEIAHLRHKLRKLEQAGEKRGDGNATLQVVRLDFEEPFHLAMRVLS